MLLYIKLCAKNQKLGTPFMLTQYSEKTNTITIQNNTFSNINGKTGVELIRK